MRLTSSSMSSADFAYDAAGFQELGNHYNIWTAYLVFCDRVDLVMQGRARSGLTIPSYRAIVPADLFVIYACFH